MSPGSEECAETVEFPESIDVNDLERMILFQDELDDELDMES
jgi:hypothetical protein